MPCVADSPTTKPFIQLCFGGFPPQILTQTFMKILVLSRSHRELAENLRALQTGLPAVVLDGEPMWLDEIVDAVVAALPPRCERS